MLLLTIIFPKTKAAFALKANAAKFMNEGEE